MPLGAHGRDRLETPLGASHPEEAPWPASSPPARPRAVRSAGVPRQARHGPSTSAPRSRPGRWFLAAPVVDGLVADPELIGKVGDVTSSRTRSSTRLRNSAGYLLGIPVPPSLRWHQFHHHDSAEPGEHHHGIRWRYHQSMLEMPSETMTLRPVYAHGHEGSRSAARLGSRLQHLRVRPWPGSSKI